MAKEFLLDALLGTVSESLVAIRGYFYHAIIAANIFFVLLHRPGYRFPYVPYEIYVTCLDSTALRIRERLSRFAEVGDI